MHIEFLKTFLEVAKCGSVSKVAEQIGISQPSLSRQLRVLEDEVGLKLLVRRHRGMKLTPAGAAFRRKIMRVVGQLDRAMEEMRTYPPRV